MSRQDIIEGNYKPRLTIYRRGMTVECKIEFSASKLLFGNNFQELVDEDYGRCVEGLTEKLKVMGIACTEQSISNARVSAVHFCKNILLDQGVSCSMVLDELSQCDLYSRLDVNQTDYRNEGHVLKWHANSYELVFYDKVKDLRQAQVSEKRAVERDNYMQLSILDRIEQVERKAVLRMEIRFNTISKIKTIIRGLGIGAGAITFRTVFSKALAQKVLLAYWDILLPQLNIVQVNSKDLSEAFVLLKSWNTGIKVEKLLKLFSGLVLISDGGIRSLREKLGYKGRQSSKWYRYMSDLKSLKLPQSGCYRAAFVIGKLLKEFQPLKLSDFSLKST
jgi:hypothetical protein